MLPSLAAAAKEPRDRGGDIMNTSPSSVVAVSNDALRPELLERLFVDDNDYDVIVVESIERAYSRIRQVQPTAVVVLMDIDDVNACQLLSMLHIDHELRGMAVLSCTTTPDAGATHHLGDFEERCHPRNIGQPVAS